MRERRTRLSRLGHEYPQRYGGVFLAAKDIYKLTGLSAEGHRNYPLREAKSLRQHPDLQLPFAPWLEQWGRRVATHPGLDRDDKLLVVRQLLRGCDSTSRAWCVPNQVGYYRALRGISEALSLEALSLDLDKGCRAVLKSHEVRSHLAISESQFAGKLAEKVVSYLVR